MIFSWIHPQVSGPIQLETEYINPWGPWWNTSYKWGGCVFIQGRSLYLFFQKLIFLLPLYPTCIHVVPAEWTLGGGVEVKFLPHNLCVGFPWNVDIIYPILNMYIGVRDIMVALRHTHGLNICFNVWEYCECVRAHHFDKDKLNLSSIILAVVSIRSLIGPQLALYISGQWVSDQQA